MSFMLISEVEVDPYVRSIGRRHEMPSWRGLTALSMAKRRVDALENCHNQDSQQQSKNIYSFSGYIERTMEISVVLDNEYVEKLINDNNYRDTFFPCASIERWKFLWEDWDFSGGLDLLVDKIANVYIHFLYVHQYIHILSACPMRVIKMHILTYHDVIVTFSN